MITCKATVQTNKWYKLAVQVNGLLLLGIFSMVQAIIANCSRTWKTGVLRGVEANGRGIQYHVMPEEMLRYGLSIKSPVLVQEILETNLKVSFRNEHCGRRNVKSSFENEGFGF